MDDLMIRVIPNDFNVEILANNEEECLLYGFRQGHVHFLKYYDNYIAQYHIPRFLLAFNLNLLYEKLEDPGIKKLHTLVSKRFMITVSSKESFVFKLGSRQFHLTQREVPEFFMEVRRDIEIYQKAMELVRSEADRGGSYFELQVAIAFERLSYKNLETSGSLSLWSMYRDWMEKKFEVPDDWFMELAPGLQQLAEEETGVKMLEIYYRLQMERHLSAFVPDEAVALGNYADLIFFAYKKLNSVQKIQFKTLAELHKVNFILPLALVTGIIDQKQYTDFVCNGFQPDSKEEQDHKYETSIVEAFGSFFR